jgi:hypothetical protein
LGKSKVKMIRFFRIAIITARFCTDYYIRSIATWKGSDDDVLW